MSVRCYRIVICALLAALLGGCSTLAYYGQAVHGELALLDSARPVEQVLADPATPPKLRRRLETAHAIRAFASRELGLPDDDSYRSFVLLDREFPVWNVIAAPEFSLQPEQWCFLFAGCVPYRGYFDRADAERFASGLRVKGLDVMVGPVPAFSTLGWFDDPLLSSMLYWSDTELAQLIFHELAHRLIYVKGDADFNEAFATTVAAAGVRRWLMQRPDGEAKYERWQQDNAHDAAVRARIMRARGELKALYAEKLPPTTMRARKAHIFMRLYADYEKMKRGWPGYDGYDGFFSLPLNNALLSEVDTYERLTPAFRALLAQANGDLPAFYEKVRSLARMSSADRRKAIEKLLAVSEQ